MANEYATLAQLKARLAITDTSSDTVLSEVLEAASRAIDDHCGRRFYAASETRTLTALSPKSVMTGDVLSVSQLLTDEDGDYVYETTWSATDYDLMPRNASLDGQPFRWIERRRNASRSFPLHEGGVRVTGSFGFATAVPPAVREACLLVAARVFKRGEVPLGVLGMPATGTAIWVSREDSDALRLLEPYVVRSVVGAV